jgi:hypothetical protein
MESKNLNYSNEVGPLQPSDLDRLCEIQENYSNGGVRTIVVMPSISFPYENLKGILGIEHYEARSLWEILAANCPRTKVIFITSRKMTTENIKHLLSSSKNGSSIRQRVSFISLDDPRIGISLGDKLLARLDLIRLIKNAINPRETYLESFISTDCEKKVAEALGIAPFGSFDQYWATKSGNRKIFQECGINFADGINDIYSESQLKLAIVSLWSKYPSITKYMMKLDTGVSGDGNAIVQHKISFDEFKKINQQEKDQYLNQILLNAKYQSKFMGWTEYSKQISVGMIIELFISGELRCSPSAQGKIHPDGTVELLSTHEQILDRNGMKFLGGTFPASKEYRKTLTQYTELIGKELATRGVIGSYSIDFLLSDENGQTVVWVIEINIRKGGTTHPYFTARYLTNSRYDYKKGILINDNNQEVVYISNDNFIFEQLKEYSVSYWLDLVNDQGLLFSAQKQEGVVFHLLEAMNPVGKIGYTVISKNIEDARKLEQRLFNLVKTL